MLIRLSNKEQIEADLLKELERVENALKKD
jgi:hypothetical protein